MDVIFDNLGKLKPFDGSTIVKHLKPARQMQRASSKIVDSIEDAIKKSGLKDGMTISFHHHFRNGDYVVNMVTDAIARLGIKNLTLAASSLTDIHAPLIKHIKNGVITRIETSGLRGELGQAVSYGLMDTPVIFRSHGDRGRVISNGELVIDVAFLGVPSCDPYGNANGYSRRAENSSECGSLGYAKLDAQYANKVVLITDHLESFPNTPFGIPQSQVDYIVVVDAIGDPKGIMSGAMRVEKNPRELLIAKIAADAIEASGYFEDGFSFQTGSGGSSLAVTSFLKEKMIKKKITASFDLGGITAQIVNLHEEGLVEKILDVQSFDLTAVHSLKNNRFHQQIDAAYYANPDNPGSAVNQLDFVVLSALEVDIDFNVNVLTGSDGIIRGAIGGHPDTAAGACVSIVTAPMIRARMSTVKERVNTIVTPGCTIDVLVTDYGIAVNPRRPELLERFKKANLLVHSIEELLQIADSIVGKPEPVKYTDKIVGMVMYRDGTVIDTIRQVAG